MTDAEQLVTLRAWLGWPWKTLDPLAVEVATMGDSVKPSRNRPADGRAQGEWFELELNNPVRPGTGLRFQLSRKSIQRFLQAPPDPTAPSAQAGRPPHKWKGGTED